VEARLTRAQLEHALASLLGLAPAEFSLPRTAQLPTVPAVPLQLPSQLLERRPDIAAAERRVAAANAQMGAADAAFFPALTLSANLGFRDKNFGSLFNAPSRIWSLGPNFVYALFDGGGRQAASDSAKASYEQAVASYRGTVLTALQEVEDNLVAAAALHEEEVLQKELVAAAGKTLEVTSNQYAAGTVSYLNVVSAQSAELSAQTSLINLQSRRLAALNTLLKNIAGRWDAISK
jgi:NodT family efflux transporter outer membrane factor (OMF) lipoprotein